jgi:CubicO group peptidase (beta-lactamase class C family)
MEHGSMASMQGALSPQILEQIAPAIEGAIASGDPAGAVTLLWRDGEVAHVAALGMRDVERKLPMQRDTLFRIASMTKPITSALILMLMEEGKLRFDDPIVKWGPEFAARRVLKRANGPVEDTYPAPRDITIDDLLTHRSGLAYAFTSIGPIADAYQKALGDLRTIALGSDEFLKALATVPLTYAPGERWRYSHSTDVLGFIAERIEGRPLRDLLLERILEPLGMVDTDFWIPAHKRERAAVVYSFDKNAGAPAPVALPPRDAVPKFCNGGGGLVSTADDYLKFAPHAARPRRSGRAAASEAGNARSYDREPADGPAARNSCRRGVVLARSGLWSRRRDRHRCGRASTVRPVDQRRVWLAGLVWHVVPRRSRREYGDDLPRSVFGSACARECRSDRDRRRNSSRIVPKTHIRRAEEMIGGRAVVHGAERLQPAPRAGAQVEDRVCRREGLSEGYGVRL